MSTKENIDFIKQELNSEEKFLESFIKVERFYKKYKVAILGLVGVAVVGTIGYYTKSYIDSIALKDSNIAYSTLLENPNDIKALEVLKSKNKPLYSLYQLQTAVKSGNVEVLKELSANQNNIISDISKYEIANIEQKYNEYDGKIYKDMSKYQEAFYLIKDEKYKEANVLLNSISEDSPVSSLANLLKHHLITKLDK